MALSLFLIFLSAALMGYFTVPFFYQKSVELSEKRQQAMTLKMEKIIPRARAKQYSRWFILAPLGLSVAAYFVFPIELRMFGVLFGLIIGFLLPGIVMKAMLQKTRDKFHDQLVDALMIMSSSFRGGLSLVQAMEAVVEEMPDPINQEFGTVLGENKMGVSLDEAFQHLYNRMPSPALQQMITAILLARETGGNLPVIFTRIVGTIRENKKIRQQLDTLTIQGKLQGLIMALLPIVFGVFLYSTSRHLMDNMFHSQMGRAMLVYAVISEVIGAFFVWKISTFKDI